MVWKNDLAKLKQELKAEEVLSPPKAVPVKKAPKPEGPLDMECEDAMFLAAMGRRAPRPKAEIPVESPVETRTIPAVEPPKEEGFLDAMNSLKGIKPVRSRIPEAKPVEAAPKVVLEPQPAVLPKMEEPGGAAPEAAPAEVSVVVESPRTGPREIHLAAGMAIEVDGVLDLRGHTPGDAMERLKERVLDGQAMGWRTLHATLGTPELNAAFLEFLNSPEALTIARYAQAPIPMGGKAWILYFGNTVPSGRESL